MDNKKVKPSCKAYVLDDGKVISQSYLDRYAMKNAAESKQLPADKFSSSYEPMGLIAPLYNIEALAQLAEINTYHNRCVKTKAKDTVGLGWKIRAIETVESPNESQRQAVEEFLYEPHPELTFIEILDRVMNDYEATGTGYLEVLRAIPNGPLTGMAHIPSHTMRVHRDQKKYAQIRGTKKRWFKRIGVPLDIHMDTGEEHPEGSLQVTARASEIIPFMNYSSRSDYYGLPDVLPALGAILGDLSRRDYNIKFFENHAIPSYAVIVEGADLDEDTEKTIHDFFHTKVKGNPHSTLVLTATTSSGQTVNIKFEKLAVDVKEASFRMYRIDNRDEVLAAHGMPPYRAGISETGNLGGSTAKESTEIYKMSVIKPRQEMIEQRINRYIVWGAFGAYDWEFKFDEIDTEDEAKDADLHDKYFKMGALTPNQIRKMKGLEPSTHPAMDWYYVNGMPITGDPAFMPRMPEQQAFIESVKNLHSDLRDLLVAVKTNDTHNS